ncbi:hypothetical protein STEG23_001743, partial [Scotinomys teguina]
APLKANPQDSVGNPLLNLRCEYLDVHYGTVKPLFHFSRKNKIELVEKESDDRSN